MNHREDPRTPVPWLLPALALWGWQTGLLVVALTLGAALEARRLTRARVELGREDFQGLWNFTTLLFIGAALYVFFARKGASGAGSLLAGASAADRFEGMREISRAALTFFRWMPMVFAPFVLAHAWTEAGALPLSTYSLYEQRRARREPELRPPEWAGRRLHPAHPFLGLVLFASTASTEHAAAYLPALAAAVTLALRTSGRRRAGWARFAAAGVALVLATAAHRGVTALRDALQLLENRMLSRGGGNSFDPERSRMAIGSIGRMKLSGGIVLRVATPDGRGPGLLREASYDRLRGRVWSAGDRNFAVAADVTDGRAWRIVPGAVPGRRITISRFTDDGNATLALPGDALAVTDFPATGIETNGLGAAQVKGAPSLLAYTVEHGVGGGFDGPPGPGDLELDPDSSDTAAVRRLSATLALGTLPEASAVVAAVGRHFGTRFEYSLTQARPAATNASGPIARFLEETRAGHCEYFATATTLLLRSAGIPARYAVGYSPGTMYGGLWVARVRDAHAWCRAHVGGRWIDVDTTPGIWRERESGHDGWTDRARDFLSWLRYRLEVWRRSGDDWQTVPVALALAALAWLGWRQIRGTRLRRASRAGTPRAAPTVAGMDSEFYALARRIEREHGARESWETMPAWLRRVMPGTGSGRTSVLSALALHQRLRFDPRGLSGEERRRLEEIVGQSMVTRTR